MSYKNNLNGHATHGRLIVGALSVIVVGFLVKERYFN